jgi:hypothetical protein
VDSHAARLCRRALAELADGHTLRNEERLAIPLSGTAGAWLS